jgi:hypothetical protein
MVSRKMPKVEYDNEHYVHSVLGYKPPRQFEQAYHTSHGTQFTAA